MSIRSLSQIFIDTALAHPGRPALAIGEQVLDYAALRQRAQAVAATLMAHRQAEGPPLTAVLGQRSVTCFAGIVGALMSGHGYVPMLPSFPPARLALMLRRSRAQALVVDAAGIRSLAEVLPQVPQPMTVLLLDGPVDEALRTAAPQHTLLGPDALLPAQRWVEPTVGPDAIAYLLFTSGSTGEPKAVMVAHRNIDRFLKVVVERYGLGPTDRFSHLFDVTFDLSLFDLFGAWSVGGCLCCPTMRQRLLPAQYVADAGLTVWFSVPSTALLMQQTRLLSPGVFGGLRLSLFCGEALPVSVVEAWAEAAPASIVENLYGPTELTLACTVYRWDEAGRAQTQGDVVPIGEPFPGMTAVVLDSQLQQVAPGEAGELALAGAQVALGYWEDPERTAAAFVVPPGFDQVHYRTGDRVRRPVGEQPLVFLGRIDTQIKVRGYRVELGEIEAAVRAEAQVSVAVALGWPETASGGAEAVVTFIDDATVDTDALLDRLEQRLPKYMVPRQVVVVEQFPLNDNGKVDRNALRASLTV